MRTVFRLAVAAGAFVWALAMGARLAEGREVCAASKTAEVTGTRRELLRAAKGDAIVGERARARAIYLALLTRDPEDAEAEAGLARVDAWDGCWLLAERGYRRVLERYPNDEDARAGLVDLLLWQSRFAEAELELREGLARTPASAELLVRRARLAHWRGDEAAAIRDAEAAARLSPLDPTMSAQRDQLFLGEARLGMRLQFLPAQYDDIVTNDAEVMQRFGRARVHLLHQLVTRTGAFGATTVVDARRAVGAYYHYAPGGWAGLELAFTTPAIALPRWAATLAMLVPVNARVGLYVATGAWSYSADKAVYLVAPAVSLALTDTLEIGLRSWVSTVVTSVPGQNTATETVVSGGLRGLWKPEPATVVGAEYTYGVQLDQNPTVAQLVQLRSHVLTVFGRHMFTPTVGVQPVLAVERRENRTSGDVMFVPAVEGSVLVRW
ncbi:MAG: tetratricopeptide repeat protein [Labilithrix sp.]|nr:tetratricopeptide repeat protein [Labilithrix sp.]